jgi:hypothetical protein
MSDPLYTRNKGNVIHGCSFRKARTPEYVAWKAMRTRCTNKKQKYWHRYGGRGIKVCERWNTFQNFLADMGPKPSPTHSLDRFPNKDGNYEPGNCRWATPLQQVRNATSNRLYTFNGETLCISEWAQRKGWTYHFLRGRLNWGWSIERALTTPKRIQSP